MQFERFEHPSTDGSHDWTVLAFENGKQIGGYLPPCRWTGEKYRAYVGSRPIRSLDCDSEQECVAFIARPR